MPTIPAAGADSEAAHKKGLKGNFSHIDACHVGVHNNCAEL